MSDRLWRWALIPMGAFFLIQGVWAALDARGFAATVANFGPTNEHLVHDFAAAAMTFGVGLIVATRVSRWRTPILAGAALWNGLHAVSHVVDAAKSVPAIVGPIEAVLLVAVTAALAVLTRLSGNGWRGRSAWRNAGTEVHRCPPASGATATPLPRSRIQEGPA